MKKTILSIFITLLVSACGGTPFEDSAPQNIEVDGYPFKIQKYKGSDSYAVFSGDFWCKKTNCSLTPADYPKAIKAVEHLTDCVVDRQTFQVFSRPAFLQMSVICKD